MTGIFYNFTCPSLFVTNSFSRQVEALLYILNSIQTIKQLFQIHLETRQNSHGNHIA